jgi:ABC-type multidrug transport system ATPase subunit
VEALLDKKVAHLSGGQKQRLNLMRSLCLGVSLLILDEPLNGLDFVSVKKVLALLEHKRREGCSFLIISHNEEIFDLFIPQKKVFYLGKSN